jgi:NAD+ kinase
VIRLGVVGHPGYAALPAALRKLHELAPGLEFQLFVEPELLKFTAGAELLEKPGQLDAMLTMGGDGTLLRGARLIAGHAVPIIGVNMGRLGFLTCCPADEMPSALMRFARRDYLAESRMALFARVLDAGGKERESWISLNDVVLHKGGFARVVSLKVTANGEMVARYAADGVVISTPTGSTAYSLSAGGPVVFPTLESVIVTPVSPHTLAIRPVVLPSSAEITVHAEDGPEVLLVTVDGQVGTTFAVGETLSVHRAEGGVLIVRFPGSSYFATLREKLGWGGLAERDNPSSC